MNKLAAKLVVAILVVLGLFQLALVLGAPWGHFAWGGQNEVLPANLRAGSMFAILLYALIAVIVLNRTGILNMLMNERAVRIATWAITAYFGLGVILNAVSRSQAERYVMTPVVLTLTLLMYVIARSKD